MYRGRDECCQSELIPPSLFLFFFEKKEGEARCRRGVGKRGKGGEGRWGLRTEPGEEDG